MRSENVLENHLIFGRVFSRFSSTFGTQNGEKISLGDRMTIFRKSLFFLSKTKVFQVWDPPKIDVFAPRNALAKTHHEKDEKSSIWAPFWLPKTTRKATRSATRFATLCNSPASRREPTGIGVWRLSPRQSI